MRTTVRVEKNGERIAGMQSTHAYTYVHIECKLPFTLSVVGFHTVLFLTPLWLYVILLLFTSTSANSFFFVGLQIFFVFRFAIENFDKCDVDEMNTFIENYLCFTVFSFFALVGSICLTKLICFYWVRPYEKLHENGCDIYRREDISQTPMWLLYIVAQCVYMSSLSCSIAHTHSGVTGYVTNTPGNFKAFFWRAIFHHFRCFTWQFWSLNEPYVVALPLRKVLYCKIFWLKIESNIFVCFSFLLMSWREFSQMICIV